MTEDREQPPIEREPQAAVDPAAKTQPAEGGRDEADDDSGGDAADGEPAGDGMTSGS